MLNEQSRTRTFSLDDVDWSRPLDVSRDWMPEAFVSASYLPSFAQLPAEIRRRYNQLNALAVCEQFVWFEEDLISRVITNLLGSNELTGDLRLCLENFVREEERHSEMFKRVLLKAEPDYYSNHKYQYFTLTRFQSKFFENVVARPHLFLVWTWMAIYFEERTLHISQLYRRAERASSQDQKIDETFSRVHFLHMIDEARHLQIDQYLLEAFFVHESAWKKRLAAHLTHKVFEAYRAPKRIALRILETLKKEDPSVTNVCDQIASELPLLATSPEFKHAMFSNEALGRTRELLKSHPEMKAAYQSLAGR